jgi:RND superfamily putative drug exporter
LIERLRPDVLSPAEGGTVLHLWVGGQAAIFRDFAGVMTGKLPCS